MRLPNRTIYIKAQDESSYARAIEIVHLMGDSVGAICVRALKAYADKYEEEAMKIKKIKDLK